MSSHPCQGEVRRHYGTYRCGARATWAAANDVGAAYSCGSHLNQVCEDLLTKYGEPGTVIKVETLRPIVTEVEA